MFESPIKRQDLIIYSIFSFAIVLSAFILSFFDQRSKIVFCDVGQGDAAYIRIDSKIDILIDAGPDKSVLSCLGKYMPFWDRKIELAFLSHPNSDHYNGYFNIIERYKIDKFITVDSPFKTRTYKKLLENLNSKKIPISFSTSGNNLKVGDALFKVLWPPQRFNSNNDNDYSSVILLGTVLFTGDASSFVLSRLSHQSIGHIDILKVPHHGSKNGLNKIFLDLADPKVAVISVGKNNSYGHPSTQVLDLLKAKKIDIKRTDEEGNVVFRISNVK